MTVPLESQLVAPPWARVMSRYWVPEVIRAVVNPLAKISGGHPRV
jgi:hypothetical protein